MDGLATAAQHYDNYGMRARELKAAGRKILGYLSALTPIEILTAADVVPFRLKGYVSEAITKGDAYMETIVCPFIRNVFDTVLKGKYDFLDGMIMPHQCDSIDRTNDVWSYRLKLPYWHFLNVPHVTDGPSMEFMVEILRAFIVSLEEFTGSKITNQALTRAITSHNDNRRLMRSLYALRRLESPLISGTELTKVLVAAMSLPVDESSALIENVLAQVEQRFITQGPCKRIMLIGDQIDDVRIPQLIEEADAWLVMDDISIGGKMYWNDVIDADRDPVRAIAERYLGRLKIPTTFEASGDTYEENLEARFGHIRQHIKEFKVDGVILLVYKYCDPYGFEVPAIKSYIESTGTPVLYVEDEYSISSFGRLKTRIEAFLEMIS